MATTVEKQQAKSNAADAFPRFRTTAIRAASVFLGRDAMTEKIWRLISLPGGDR